MSYFHLYFFWIFTISVITLLLYGFDKAQSKTKGRRIPEAVQHVLALAGGFAGGWLGRSVFHHKTNKASFTFVLVVSTLIHAAGWWWLFGR